MLLTGTIAESAKRCGLTTPSIVIEEIAEDAPLRVTLGSEHSLYPASMIKVPIAAALCASWARSERRQDDRVTVEAADMTENDTPPGDTPSPLTPGYSAGLEELAKLMLTRSDNVATNVLIDLLGRKAMTEHAHSIGLTNTYVRRKLSGDVIIEDPGWDKSGTGRNAHPAGDAARLFELIARRQLPGAQWLEETLRAQKWNEKLPCGLREGDRFAHKTGDTSQVTHDGGILDTAEGRRYVIVVYTSLPTSPQGDACFQAFMKELRPLL